MTEIEPEISIEDEKIQKLDKTVSELTTEFKKLSTQLSTPHKTVDNSVNEIIKNTPAPQKIAPILPVSSGHNEDKDNEKEKEPEIGISCPTCKIGSPEHEKHDHKLVPSGPMTYKCVGKDCNHEWILTPKITRKDIEKDKNDNIDKFQCSNCNTFMQDFGDKNNEMYPTGCLNCGSKKANIDYLKMVDWSKLQ